MTHSNTRSDSSKYAPKKASKAASVKKTVKWADMAHKKDRHIPLKIEETTQKAASNIDALSSFLSSLHLKPKPYKERHPRKILTHRITPNSS